VSFTIARETRSACACTREFSQIVSRRGIAGSPRSARTTVPKFRTAPAPSAPIAAKAVEPVRVAPPAITGTTMPPGATGTIAQHYNLKLAYTSLDEIKADQKASGSSFPLTVEIADAAGKVLWTTTIAKANVTHLTRTWPASFVPPLPGR
jgi:hypothetical protein